MAEVRSLQSQLHKVNGRSAPGDRMILPLSFDVRGLGDKNSSTLSKMIWNGTSFQDSSVSMKEELRTKGTIWNTIWPKSRIFL